MWSGFYEGIVNVITKLANLILAIFPKSPFAAQIESWTPPVQLGWFAWFFPVKAVLSVIAIWLVAVSAYYVVSVIARWVKILGE